MNIVSIVGSESTGKTTLAAELAVHFGGVWLPEYAREYLRSDRYYQDDLLAITLEQWNRECAFVKASPNIGLLDTDLVVIRVWWQEKFGHVPEMVDECLARQCDRLYLLTVPDIEWQFDPLRESRGDRERLHQIYIETLHALDFQWAEVSGLGEVRTNNARRAIVRHFGKVSSE